MSKSVENKQETEIFQNKKILKILVKMLAIYFNMLYNINVFDKTWRSLLSINERYYENCVVISILLIEYILLF